MAGELCKCFHSVFAIRENGKQFFVVIVVAKSVVFALCME